MVVFVHKSKTHEEPPDLVEVVLRELASADPDTKQQIDSGAFRRVAVRISKAVQKRFILVDGDLLDRLNAQSDHPCHFHVEIHSKDLGCLTKTLMRFGPSRTRQDCNSAMRAFVRPEGD